MSIAWEVARFRQENHTLNTGQVAAHFGINERTVRRYCQQVREQLDEPLELTPIRIPANGGPAPLQPLVISDPNAMLLFDLHTPHHNERLLERALTIKQRHFPHIPRLIIGGDLYDFSAISRHPKDQTEAGVQEEIRIAGYLLHEFSRHFAEVYITGGNHDRRFTRLAGGIGLQHLVDMSCAAARRLYGDFPEPIVTELDWLTLDAPTPERRWRVGHPGSYSGDGGKTPAIIATNQQINVATGHNHHAGMQVSNCGRFLGWDVGHCLSPERISYKVQNLTRFKAWSSGIGFIEDGFAYHYTDAFTNWASLGL